ncbi:MAG: ribonuclease HII [Patescibacteria group bacterium]
MKLIIGVDEAGRGPLAGPVTVGAFVAGKRAGNSILKNIFGDKLRDSKKLTPNKREEIYKKFLELQKAKKIGFSVSHISNKVIDKQGISKAIQLGVNRSLNKLHHTFLGEGDPPQFRLDGLLKAPPKYKNQKTIIKGDEKDVFIACASIVAKVSRDALMCRLASKYPQYGFAIHKGYGTALHRKLIKKLGTCPLHRFTFCKKIKI